jgi:class 3 adenylate cyclase
VINLAARLMSEARGRVLCDTATHTHVHDPKRLARVMDFEPLPEMRVCNLALYTP